jgi:hypothetical protein
MAREASSQMAKRRSNRNKFFTVICRTRADENEDKWKRVAVSITGVCDAQDAANNACLFLIYNRGGMAEASFVAEGLPRLSSVDGGIFDAMEYDDYITHAGTILAVLD